MDEPPAVRKLFEQTPIWPVTLGKVKETVLNVRGVPIKPIPKREAIGPKASAPLEPDVIPNRFTYIRGTLLPILLIDIQQEVRGMLEDRVFKERPVPSLHVSVITPLFAEGISKEVLLGDLPILMYLLPLNMNKIRG